MYAETFNKKVKTNKNSPFPVSLNEILNIILLEVIDLFINSVFIAN